MALPIKERKLGRLRQKNDEFVYGLYDVDEDTGKWTCFIDPRQPPQERLDTIIHEWLHHRFTDMGEMEVERLAHELRHALWRDGWRRIYQ